MQYICNKESVMTKEIKELFREHNGYLTTRQMPDNATYMAIQRLVNKGVVERVRRGVYYYPEDEGELMIDVSKVTPGGVLCLYSAWFYYQLSVQIPQSYCIAIERSRKIVLPKYPPITLYYWKKAHHELGITKQIIDGYEVEIYDLEKCVCDAVKYRNKVGIDVCSEVIKEYLKRKDRDIMRLTRYARIMRIETTLKKYLEIAL